MSKLSLVLVAALQGAAVAYRRAKGAAGQQLDAAAEGAQAGRPLAGSTIDTSLTDLWTFSTMRVRASIFTDDMPETCFEEEARTQYEEKRGLFTSVQEWSQEISRRSGLDLGGGFNGLSASLARSTVGGSSEVDNAEHRTMYFTVSRAHKTHSVNRLCMSNASYLSEDVARRLQTLPATGTDERTMENWRTSIVMLYGTHVVDSSTHGAMIRATSWFDNSCRLSESCLDTASCTRFGLGSINNEWCRAGANCTNSSACRTNTREQCRARGGDPSVAASMCDAGATPELVQQFLTATDGNMDSQDSVMAVHLTPLHAVLQWMGVGFDQAYQVRKATEFHFCTAPWAWVLQENGEFGCSCARRCQNGGTLDPRTCTCACQGNDNHGWTGAECTATYGQCQSGVGSWTAGGAWRWNCRERSDGRYPQNYCGGHEWVQLCQPTEVCCNRAEGGVCCPFGSTCNCRRRRCQCVPPRVI